MKAVISVVGIKQTVGGCEVFPYVQIRNVVGNRPFFKGLVNPLNLIVVRPVLAVPPSGQEG